MNIHRINETHQHISFIYFATSNTRAIAQGETEVSDELHWFTAEELDDPEWGVAETIRHYAKSALAAVR